MVTDDPGWRALLDARALLMSIRGDPDASEELRQVADTLLHQFPTTYALYRPKIDRINEEAATLFGTAPRRGAAETHVAAASSPQHPHHTPKANDMTTPDERLRTINQTRQFLIDLRSDPRVPEDFRHEAHRLLRHYPTPAELYESRFDFLTGGTGLIKQSSDDTE